MRRWVLAVLLVLPAAQATVQTTDARDVAEIKATMVAMWDAIEKGDVDRYATHVHPDFTSFGGNDTWTDAGSIDGKRFTSRGKSTRIFVREGGRWLCIHGHYTAVA